MKNRTQKVSFKLPESTDTCTIKLYSLTEQDITDIPEWIKLFKDAKEICEWGEETVKTLLRSLISLQLREKLPRFRNMDSYLTELCKLSSPRTKIAEYRKTLQMTLQENFYTINDYYTQIKKLASRISIAQNLNPAETKRLEDDSFLTNLHYQTRVKMNELGMATVTQITEIISLTEDEILSHAHVQKLSPASTNTQSSPKEEVQTKQTGSDKPKSNKYCTYHKSRTHNTSDCLTVESKKKTTKRPDQIRKIEENTTPREIKIEAKINDLNYSLLIDTGATSCFIEESLVYKLKIDITQDPSVVEMADGYTQTSPGYTFIKLHFPHNFTIYQKFKILKTLSNELILGMNFLSENKATLDFTDNSLTFKETDKIKSLNENTKKIIVDTKINNPELGEIKGHNMIITLKDTSRIVRREYPVSLSLRRETGIHLKELLNKGIIRKSSSKYSSPAFPKKKKNGDIRLLINFSEINEITESDHFPFTNMEELSFMLHDKKIFSTIDLKMGFYQIPIEESCKHLTAFTLMGNKYEFNRMPFGLKNAPATFQRAIVNIIGHLNYVTVYIDDILVHSRNVEEHSKHIEEVLKVLKQNSIGINFEKSEFSKREVNYLGQIISEQGIRPITTNLEKIKIDDAPRTKKQLQSLIGSLNWYRPFVPNLSSKIQNITELLKTENFKWTEKHSNEVKNTIHAINNCTTIKFPDVNKPFTIHTDASEKGCGAVLTQSHGVIKIFSKKFSEAELKYTIVEKEFLAIIKGLESFKKIILGGKITLYTDSNNCINFRNTESNRIARWKWKIEQFEIEIKHIKGSENSIADKISRENLSLLHEDRVKSLITNIKTMGKDDNNIRKNLEELHKELGHPGITAMRNLLRIKCNINLYTMIYNIINKCHECNTSKHSYKRKLLSIGGHTSSFPNEHICMDIAGPYVIKPLDTDQQIYFLVIVDKFSRYTKILPIKQIKYSSIIKRIIEDWVLPYGKPKHLTADRGRQFDNKLFKSYCESNSIKLHLTTPGNATGNSQAERQIRTLNEIMRIYNKGFTKKFIFKITEIRLNTIPNTTTKIIPHEAFFQKDYITQERINNFEIIKEQIINLTNKSIIKKQQKLIKVRSNKLPSENDEVFIRNKVNRKQDKLFTGPHKVLEITETSIKVLVKGKEKWISLNNVKP